MEVFLGTIMTFGFQFAPSGWQQCSGQTLSISQNNALFALLGTTYGGNGVQTFMLPDLRGRIPMSQGNGSGLTPRVLGEFDGAESVGILISNLPAHTHVATFTPSGAGSGYMASTNTAGNALVPSATNNVLAGSPNGPTGAAIWATSPPAPSIPLGGSSGGSGGTVSNAPTGNNIPTELLNPTLVLNFSIALTGYFPSRN